jgi:hypothetical protein
MSGNSVTIQGVIFFVGANVCEIILEHNTFLTFTKYGISMKDKIKITYHDRWLKKMQTRS